MSKPIEETFAATPIFAIGVAVANWVTAGFVWFTHHADDAAKVFALAGAIFGMMAAYYAMRVQRRNLQHQVKLAVPHPHH